MRGEPGIEARMLGKGGVAAAASAGGEGGEHRQRGS
jgi:hypothetical protein